MDTAFADVGQLAAYPNRMFSSAAFIRRRFEKARKNHLGYPYNLDFDASLLSEFNGYLINNLGDPYAGSHYGTEVCDLEIEVVDWMKALWECDPEQSYWGSVVASGTEGNLWAIYLAREALTNPILICSEDAHYSLPKAGKILGVETTICRSLPSGEICLDHLAEIAQANRARDVILALTCGTTVRGAHDDIAGAIDVLDCAGISAKNRYVHVDGALNAMVIPFLDDAAPYIRPSFRLGIDSISTSGHKMIGTPMPCGILVTKEKYARQVASAIAYLRSNDTTLMGSRNGHATLAIWQRIVEHGKAGFKRDAEICEMRARDLAEQLRAMGVDVLHNRHSLTVVFPKPSEETINLYQLACEGDLAHAITMPNVRDDLIQRFLADYADDLRRQAI